MRAKCLISMGNYENSPSFFTDSGIGNNRAKDCNDWCKECSQVAGPVWVEPHLY